MEFRLSTMAIVLTLVCVLPPNAHSDWRAFCAARFGKFFNSRSLTLKPDTIADLRTQLADNSMPNISGISDADDLFWHGVQQLPAEVHEVLRTLPSDLKKSQQILTELTNAAGVEEGRQCFFNTIQRVWSRNNLSNENADEWISSGLANFQRKRAENPMYMETVKRAWLAAVKKENAMLHWRHAGRIPLPMRTDHKGTWIKIGATEYPAKATKDGWTIRVPREIIAHPAWNPLESQKLTAVASRGIPAPKVYETILGHDGKFYLLDGNHRFELDRRREVLVWISDPPRTTSFKLWLDTINQQEPSTDDLIRFYQGELSWQQLVGDDTQKRMQIHP
jgi:hypothetical protein